MAQCNGTCVMDHCDTVSVRYHPLYLQLLLLLLLAIALFCIEVPFCSCDGLTER